MPGRPPRFGLANPTRGPGGGFGRPAALTGAGLAAALVAVLLWSALAGATTAARHPRIIGGSIVLDDYRPLVVLDEATGDVTVRLQDVFAQVGAPTYADVQAVPLAGGTLLVNRQTGEFNLLDQDNFVLKRTGGGVGLGYLAGTTGAAGLADGSSAYIVRAAPRPTVSLVDADTVEAAARITSPGAGGRVPPAGFARLAAPFQASAESVAVGGGDLFALLDAGGRSELWRLRPDPSRGTGLLPSRLAVLGAGSAPAAVAPFAGGVAVASPGRFTVVPGGRRGLPVQIDFPATRRATAVLAATGDEQESWFFFHLPGGWAVAGVDGGGAVDGPHPLAGVPAGTNLVRPVLSGGLLYTMDRPLNAQPSLWQVDPATGRARPVPGAPTYPQKSAAERANFSAAEVVGAPGRVIFDNPDSLLGVVVFTDHRQAPVIFDKSAAVTVSADGPTAIPGTAGAGTSSRPPPAPAGHPRAAPVAQPLVSPQVSCQDTNQKPRAPDITSLTASAHAVTVGWAYPLLDEQDCEPDGWAVTITAVGAPDPPQPTQYERGQLQYQFSGLRPSTHYQVVVTAFIRSQSTPSAPASFTTAAAGPDAPTSVTTAADGNGDWVVSWKPCTAADCYVPAATWVVTGAACGSGFVGQPPSVAVGGGQTSVVIPAAPANLLGMSLSFSVQGISATGLPGDPTSDRSCTQAWRPPDPSHIALAASAAPSGSTVTATLQVSTDETPDLAFGTGSPTFTYQVGGRTVGPTSAERVTVPGLAAGQTYTPQVAVAPAGHPGAAVTITGAPFSQTLPWPTMGLAVQPVVDPNPDNGTAVLQFENAPGVPLTASGQIICSSETRPFGSQPLDANHRVAVAMDLTAMGGNCTAQAVLTDQSGAYGTAPSPSVQSGFTIGAQIPASAFSAQYQTGGPGCGGGPGPLQSSCVVVAGDPQGKGVNWSVAVTSPPVCQKTVPPVNSAGGPPAFPVTFDVTRCDVTGDPVTVTVAFQYLGTTESYPVAPGGTPPTTTTTTSSSTTTTSPSTTTTSVPGGTTTTSGSSGGRISGANGGAPPPAGSPPTDLAEATAAPGSSTGVTAGLMILSLLALLAIAVAGRRRKD